MYYQPIVVRVNAGSTLSSPTTSSAFGAANNTNDDAKPRRESYGESFFKCTEGYTVSSS